jgi:hypothetical protein
LLLSVITWLGVLDRCEHPKLFRPTSGRQGDMTETMWKYEQLRAGQIYNQVMFNTREEAESFAAQMTRVEPDLFWRIEPVEARLWWN